MIRLTVPSVSARPGPPLSPALGQHQIKVADFVAEFNKSTGWTPGVPLRVGITKLPGGKFTLRVGSPPTGVFLRGATRAGNRSALWDVAVVLGVATPAGVATLLGTLRSTRWKLA